MLNFFTKGFLMYDELTIDGVGGYFSPHVEELQVIWFDDGGADDMGARINKAKAAGGENAVIRLPSSRGWRDDERPFTMLRTEVNLDQNVWYSHTKIVGSSHIASTLTVANVGSNGLIGINARNADECMLEQVRVIEEEGSVKSICLLAGGTTLKVKDCWFGNSKYGIVIMGGAGIELSDCVIESSDYGIVIDSTFSDSTIANLPQAGSIADVRVRNINCFDHRNAGLTIKSGGWLVRDVAISQSTFKNSFVNIDVEGSSQSSLVGGLVASFVN